MEVQGLVEIDCARWREWSIEGGSETRYEGSTPYLEFILEEVFLVR